MLGLTENKAQPLKAVFFTQLSATIAPMIKAWVDEGHEISAIVVYRQKRPRLLSQPVAWLELQMSVMRLVRRHRIPVIDPKSPLDWHELRRILATRAPDVAITYGFMRLIPQGLLELFPRGALNFHPALLPYYRGPQPFHWIAFDDAWETAGGVTLHEMTDAFDEGPIVAQAPMSDVPTSVRPERFVANALARITREVVPHYCAGEIRAWPQPSGDFPYASRDLPEVVVQPDWTRRYLRSLSLVFLKRPGVVLAVAGRKVRLISEAGVLGPPDGKPAAMRLRTVEFDLADCRIAYWRRSPLNKFLIFFRIFQRGLKEPVPNIPIRLGPFHLKAVGHQAEERLQPKATEREACGSGHRDPVTLGEDVRRRMATSISPLHMGSTWIKSGNARGYRRPSTSSFPNMPLTS